MPTINGGTTNVTAIHLRIAVYRTFIHHMERRGRTALLSASDIAGDPCIKMMFRTRDTFKRALSEMVALKMVEAIPKTRGSFRALSDKPSLICCVCGEALAGDTVQDTNFNLAHGTCASLVIEQHADPIYDETHVH